jgi:hypothetical protein
VLLWGGASSPFSCAALLVHLTGYHLLYRPPSHAPPSAQLNPWPLEASDLSRVIRELLADEGTRARAAAAGRMLRKESGADNAAAVIERFAG